MVCANKPWVKYRDDRQNPEIFRILYRRSQGPYNRVGGFFYTENEIEELRALQEKILRNSVDFKDF